MESKRQVKFSRQIQRDLSEIFQKEAQNILGTNKIMVTVAEVKVTPDLSEAKIYMSYMLADNPDEILEAIKSSGSYIRNLLGQKIRNQVKKIPELKFYNDESFEQSAKIENLLNSLDIPPEDEDNDDLSDYKKPLD